VPSFASRRLLLVLSDVPDWQREEDGLRRIETYKYVAPSRVKDYFPIVRNWASTKERIQVGETIYPVSSGNQVWYSDGTIARGCVAIGREREFITVPVLGLHHLLRLASR
jgi:hypothetical protein